jgi:hypothetical protein
LSPLTSIFFVTKNAPVVDVVLLGSNLSWVYRCSRLVLPTPIQILDDASNTVCKLVRHTCVAHNHDLSVYARRVVAAAAGSGI